MKPQMIAYGDDRPSHSVGRPVPTFGRLAAAVLLIGSALFGATAHALPVSDPNNPGGPANPDNDPPCLANLVVNSFVATPPTVNLGEATTLGWKVTLPRGCGSSGVTLDVNYQPAGLQGTQVVQPSFNSSYLMRAKLGNRVRGIATTSVNVTLPSVVNITSNSQIGLFLQALATDNTTINVADNVQLDLSYREDIPIGAGVTLRGGRTPRNPGPLLFTTTIPHPFLQFRGNNSRVTGMRIQGANMGIAEDDSDNAIGLLVDSNNNIEIDHNEIYGWSLIAVDVTDSADRINYALNPETIHVHDNYIHHNQHYAKDGYGVAIGPGAYALIDQNVFDWNRHAIESNGNPESGYRAYRNLVLPHGGYHRWWPWPIGWQHTHSFDVHGTDNCGISGLVSDASWNCGDGGHDVDIRYNSFYYTDGANFKLRGTPSLHPYGAFVIDNVFANDDSDDAIKQTESGLYTADNQFGVNAMNELQSCDFDADGVDDSFLATGETWWYSSGKTGPWTYLNQSKLRASQVSLGNFDNRPGCDVLANGVVYSGGMPPSPNAVTGVLAIGGTIVKASGGTDAPKPPILIGPRPVLRTP